MAEGALAAGIVHQGLAFGGDEISSTVHQFLRGHLIAATEVVTSEDKNCYRDSCSESYRGHVAS
jgi:hypothetical protein